MADHIVTPERLAASPSLLGTPPQNLSFSPNDDFVVFRAPSADDRQRYSLYRIDLSTMQQSLWIDSNDIKTSTSDITELTAEERAQRERQRDFSHGITSFLWRPYHNELLIPIDGQAFLVDVERVDADSGESVKALFSDSTRQLGFQWSPDGTKLSFVRDRDLFYLDVAADTEHRLTSDASETVMNGLPDFLAAEEMHRFTGHWWSKDTTRIFYTKTDESSVEVSYRLEIDAAGSQTVAQRYPYAGKRNPIVEVWVYDLTRGEHQRIYSTEPNDDYLARVYTTQGGDFFLLQDRLQQRLVYRKYDNQPLEDTTDVFQEVSDTWVNLSNDFKDDGGLNFTTDEVNGHRQIVAFNLDGTQARFDPITHVTRLVHVSADHIYATGWLDDPTENHFFEISRDTGTCRRLTAEPGWHEIALNHDASAFIDRYSSDTRPLSIEYTAVSSGSADSIYSQIEDKTHPYTPFLENHLHAEFGTLSAVDGQTLYYRLTPPIDRGENATHPIILYVYGGPGAQKVRNEWSPLTVQMLAQAGFGVLEVDNRGSANRGRHFEAPLYKSMGTVEVRDQIAGLEVLRSVSWADISRVGVFGHSYGGYMSLMLLCHGADHFKAGVAVAPVCSWQLYDTHYTERFMSTPDLNPEGYTTGDVLPHLNNLDSPLLLMHGMADDNVLFTNSTMIMAELQKLNKPFDLMTYPGAKHSMQEPEVTVHRFTKILEFFRQQL